MAAQAGSARTGSDGGTLATVEADATPSSFEYRSRLKVFGLPLVHIVRGIDPSSGKRPTAIGVIAIGQVAVGVLAIAAAALSLVNGMLYRIVPFLASFHLYTMAGASPCVPNLKDYLCEAWQLRQFALHAAAVALLVAAAFAPAAFAKPAALALLASALHWQLNVVAMARVYRRHALALRPSSRLIASSAKSLDDPARVG